MDPTNHEQAYDVSEVRTPQERADTCSGLFYYLHAEKNLMMHDKYNPTLIYKAGWETRRPGLASSVTPKLIWPRLIILIPKDTTMVFSISCRHQLLDSTVLMKIRQDVIGKI